MDAFPSFKKERNIKNDWYSVNVMSKGFMSDLSIGKNETNIYEIRNSNRYICKY